jgi:myo-inositol-1-phosphate synthase
MSSSFDSLQGKTLYESFKFENPSDIVVHGWDISSKNMSEAVQRAGVLNWMVEEQLRPHLQTIHPMRAVYDKNYIALNQVERADNVYPENSHLEDLLIWLQNDIRNFIQQNHATNTIVLWTANTERMMEIVPEVHNTWEGLSKAIKDNRKDLVSPSMLYAIAAIKEGCTYLNGSPQNTLVPAILQLASIVRVYVGGNDFKTGQTRFKSMMMDFLSSCGIRVSSIASYNHLGNNDGLNLSQEDCFRSKEISKRDVVADVVEANPKLYEGKNPDHCIVIKYIENVGDSKRAIDEYVSDIFMGGKQTIAVYNVCEDSLLAVPVMLDMVLVSDYLCKKKKQGKDFFPNMTELSLFFKAPLPDTTGNVVNIFRLQRDMLQEALQQ